MNVRRLVALALVGIPAAIFAGASVGHALAPGDTSLVAAAATPRPKPLDPALRTALARLDRARLRGRMALRRADTPAAQAVAALRLAAAHRRAEARLGVPLSTRLAATARAYEALTAAASTGSPVRFLRARRLVGAAESALARAVDLARRPLPEPRPAAASASLPDHGSAPLMLVLIGLAATAAVGLYVGTTTSLVPSAPPAPAATVASIASNLETERREDHRRHDERVEPHAESDDEVELGRWRRQPQLGATVSREGAEAAARRHGATTGTGTGVGAMTVTELRRDAARLGIEGRSKMRKAQLIRAVDQKRRSRSS
jgi:hypothetical protein